MRAFRKLLITQLKVYLREPMATFFTLVFPPLLLVLFGNIYGNEPTSFFGGRGSVDVSVPSYIAMVVGTVGLVSVPIATASDRERGTLRRLRMTPLRASTYMAADVSYNFLITVIGVALLIVVGRLGWGMRFDGHWASALAAFVLSVAAFLSFGYLLAGVLRTARAAQVVGMILLYPMLFLSGATIPLEVMPERVQAWASYIPLTYVVRLMRAMWAGQAWADQWGNVAVLAGMILVGAIVATRTFRWE